MFSTKVKIGLLVAVHVVAGLLFARANYNLSVLNTVDAWANLGLFALIFAEAGLLGIWCGFGETPPLLRLPVVEIATIYLCWVIVAATPYSEGKLLLILETASPTVIIFLVVSRLRFGPRRLRLVHLITDTATPSTPQPFQYAIWHILVITLAVGI